MFYKFIKRLREKYLHRFGKSKPDYFSSDFFMKNNQAFSDYDIGEWTYGKPSIYSWDDLTKLKIGKFCSIAKGVIIVLGGEHRADWVTTYPFNVIFEQASSIKGHPTSKGDIVIQNDVWIGTEALILSGVKIGNGAIVAARSVVTKDVEPYSIVGGNPAKVIKYRFDDTVIQELQRIAWWDWDIEKIKKNWNLLLSKDLDVFLKIHSTLNH